MNELGNSALIIPKKFYIFKFMVRRQINFRCHAENRLLTNADNPIIVQYVFYKVSYSQNFPGTCRTRIVTFICNNSVFSIMTCLYFRLDIS